MHPIGRSTAHRSPANHESPVAVHAQVLTVRICDSAMTGRPDVGYVKLPLVRMPNDGLMTAWLPVLARSPLLCHALLNVPEY